MQDFFKYVPAVIYEYVIYPDGRKGFNFISEACEKILGVKAQDVIKDYRVLDAIIHDEDLPSMKDTATQSRERSAEFHAKAAG